MIVIPVVADLDQDLHHILPILQVVAGVIQGLDRPHQTKLKTRHEVETEISTEHGQNRRLVEIKVFLGPGPHLQKGTSQEPKLIFQEGPEDLTTIEVEGTEVEVRTIGAIEEIEEDMIIVMIVEEGEVTIIIMDIVIEIDIGMGSIRKADEQFSNRLCQFVSRLICSGFLKIYNYINIYVCKYI